MEQVELNGFTTIKISKELHRQLKIKAAQDGRDLQEVINEYLWAKVKQEKEVV